MLEQANELYSQSQYDSALNVYESIAAADYESFQLYYNMGNAYFKTGEVPTSILYYEKALKLDPEDADAAFNLKIANEQIVDKIEALPKFFMTNWWTSFRSSYGMDQWSWICIAMVFVFSISILLYLISADSSSKRLYFYGAIFALTLAILSFFGAQSSFNARFNADAGIVFQASITIKSAPANNSEDLFVLHEGTKVLILKEENSWYNIRLEDGNEGWMPVAAVERI